MTINERRVFCGWTRVDVVVGNTTTELLFSDVGLPKGAKVKITGPVSMTNDYKTFYWRTHNKRLFVVLRDDKGNETGVVDDDDEGQLAAVINRVGWRLAGAP